MTVATERLGHRADQSDLAAPVAIAITRGHFAAIHRPGGLERPDCADALNDFARGHDTIARPVVGVADIHELDEPQRVTTSAKVFAERGQLRVVHAALYHAVD